MKNLSILIMILIIAGCGGSKKNEWDDIDYTPVYRRYEGQQNDSRYTPPNVLNCIDEDLYNCN